MKPWKIVKVESRIVVDANNDLVCVCEKPEQAKLIVKAVNQLRGKKQ